MTDLTTTTQLDRLRAALPGGTIPEDSIEPLRDLLHQLDFATGVADRATKRYPDAADVAKRTAYCAAGLDVVPNAFARLRDGAPLAGTG